MKRKLTLSQACAAYPNRYTLDHIPDWARKPAGFIDGDETQQVHYYAPKYASDAEWYHLATFPGEPGLHGNCKYMIEGPATWPLGPWLKQAPGTAIALYRRKQQKVHDHAF